MKRGLLFASVLTVGFVVSACLTSPPAPAPAAVAAPVVLPSYSVRYYPNNASGGNVPEDTKNYEAGKIVTVLGNNEGTLVNTGFAFNGWNTSSDGKGTSYDARGVFGPATFPMGDGNVQLYAVWMDPIVGPWNLTSVNGQSLILAQKGFHAMTLVTKPVGNTWIITSTPATGEPITSTGTWAVGDTVNNYSLNSANIVIFNAKVNATTMTLIPTTMGTTQEMIFSRQ